jgi:hypothetical protein
LLLAETAATRQAWRAGAQLAAEGIPIHLRHCCQFFPVTSRIRMVIVLPPGVVNSLQEIFDAPTAANFHLPKLGDGIKHMVNDALRSRARSPSTPRYQGPPPLGELDRRFHGKPPIRGVPAAS